MNILKYRFDQYSGNKVDNSRIKLGLKSLFCIALMMVQGLVLKTAEARPNTATCPAGHTISKTFSSGARWDMCWEVRDEEGVVLSDIHYKAVNKPRRRVLGEASLSQIQTEYDDGSPTEFLVTGTGLGGNSLQTLNTSLCEGGQLHQNQGRSVICDVYKPAGYIYRYRNKQRQGNKLDVFSISSVGKREFIVRWTFMENGIIEPGVGLTGQFVKQTTNSKAGWTVTAEDKIAASFVDHYFWRLDFDLDTNSGNDIVEQIRSVPSTSRLTKTKNTITVASEAAASFTPADKKFWRIRDQSIKNSANQSISYEMVMLNYADQTKGNSASSWLKNDVYITRYNACERFAVNNPDNNCGSNVSQFVNAENTNAKDVVVWYRLARHTLPRDEDFSPVAPQWNSFKLLPRDWTSANHL